MAETDKPRVRRAEHPPAGPGWGGGPAAGEEQAGADRTADGDHAQLPGADTAVETAMLVRCRREVRCSREVRCHAASMAYGGRLRTYNDGSAVAASTRFIDRQLAVSATGIDFGKLRLGGPLGSDQRFELGRGQGFTEVISLVLITADGPQKVQLRARFDHFRQQL